MNRFFGFLAASAAVLAICAPVQGQDVELLGRMHGVQPPDAYYERIRVDPDAFRPSRGWRNRTGLGGISGGGGLQPLNQQTSILPSSVVGLGPRPRPVSGTFSYPVLLGRFQDGGTPLYDEADVQREFFEGPATGQRKTVAEYYTEVSMGHVDLVGETFPWMQSVMDRSEVVGSSSGLGGDAEVGEFILELLRAADDGTVDWGTFDNDGPDGIPNSGDDDGYVDVLAVMHPTEGAECGKRGDVIWSHYWQISEATDSTSSDPDPGAGRAYETSSPSANGGYVLVDDYVVVPLLECDWDDENDFDINQIGVFAHELGHGFGLPDLYGTGSSKHAGAGDWDLMATGSWGCNGSHTATPHVPCHPGAWTKAAMGWVQVDTVAAGSSLQEVVLDPVETSGRITLVESNDESGEYFLLENRRREGFDQHLPAEGLFIWHVDPTVLGAHWGGNRINSDPDHPGVWLRQADGSNDLMEHLGSRGDAGDVFDADDGDEFHAGSLPSSFTHAGSASGSTVTNLRQGLEALTIDVENRYYQISLETDGGGTDDFLVDGGAVASSPATFRSAAFQVHTVEAPPGGSLGDGVREGFLKWEDGSSRVRHFLNARSDSLLVASYGGKEFHYDVELVSPGTVSPGTVTMDPGTADGWVPEGADVTVEARARTGFEFLSWGGAFEGLSNPFVISATEPLTAQAEFDLTYSVASNPSSVDLEAAVQSEIVLQAANGTEPVTWSVVEGILPHSYVLRTDGTLAGAPLEDGTFSVVLQATDANGLQADLSLDLVVAPPSVGTATLASPLLGGSGSPTGLQEAYLDWNGNRNNRYDVGDFRAFLQAHPDQPDQMTAPARSPPAPVVLPPVLLEPPERGTDGGDVETESESGETGGGS